jgi:WD40 repeat protein
MQIMIIALVLGLISGTASQAAAKPPAEKGAPAKMDSAGDPLPTSAVSRLGTLRWAHGTEVNYATYLHDGQQVLTVDQDGLFRLWDTPTGRLLRQFGKGDCKQLYWYVYHANEKTRVIDVVGNPPGMHVVAVSADGGTVAISHGDGNISLWDIATGKKLRAFEANLATTLAFSPDGNLLLTRGLDQLVRQYDVQTGKEIRTFGGPRSNEKLIHCNDAGGLKVSADNKIVFSIHLERQDEQAQVSVRSWEIATGKELSALKGNKAMNGFTSVAFSPQAKLVALSDLDGVIHVWDLVASKEVQHLIGAKPENGGYSAALAFSPDGKQLVVRSGYTRMCLWDMVEAMELRQFQIPKDRPSDLYTGNMAFSSDGLRIISPGREGTVRQIETKSGKEVELPMSRHCGLIETLALSPNGKTIVTQSHDHVLRVWNADDGTAIKHVQLPAPINRASFSLDGKVLALAGYDSKLHLRLWDAVHLKELREWQVSSDLDGRPTPSPRCVGALALSASGRRLAVRDYSWSIGLWEAGTEKDKTVKQYRLAGKTEEENHYFSGQYLALSPDGTLLADLVRKKEEGDQFSLGVWEVTTGKLIRKFEFPQSQIRVFAFSPDGRTIAAAGADRTISLWEVASGKERTCLGRDRLGKSSPDQVEITKSSMLGEILRIGELMCMAFSPDGNLLATGDSSGRVRLFDLTTSKELPHLDGHVGPVISLAFAENGKRLASSSTDRTALLWDVTAQASDIIPRRSLEQKQLDALWQDLRSADTEKAYEAIRVLRQFPKQVVPFFQTRLHPLEVDQKHLAQLIGELDSNVFRNRVKAQKELEKLGELAEDAIQKALQERPTEEVKTRLEALRSRPLMCAYPSLEEVRALEVMEAINTTEARHVMQTIARGAGVARFTRDAQATLERMDSKSK